MAFRLRYDWSKLTPQPAPDPESATALMRHASPEATAIVVEALRRDEAWSGLRSDAARRAVARKLLAVRWAVRAGRISEERAK